jgi:hypothetical protein
MPRLNTSDLVGGHFLWIAERLVIEQQVRAPDWCEV